MTDTGRTIFGGAGGSGFADFMQSAEYRPYWGQGAVSVPMKQSPVALTPLTWDADGYTDPTRISRETGGRMMAARDMLVAITDLGMRLNYPSMVAGIDSLRFKVVLLDVGVEPTGAQLQSGGAGILTLSDGFTTAQTPSGTSQNYVPATTYAVAPSPFSANPVIGLVPLRAGQSIVCAVNITCANSGDNDKVATTEPDWWGIAIHIIWAAE